MLPYLAIITLLLFPQSGIGDDVDGSGSDDNCTDLLLCPEYTSSTNTMFPATTLAPLAPSVNPTPNVQSNETSRSTTEGLSGGAVAGIVVSVLVGVAVSAGIATISVLLILKYVKIGGNKVIPIAKSKVVPLTKSKAGTESVECGKQSLLETFPKPE